MSKHIINLEDYKTDGSKTGANNPFLSTPNNITHCQLRYDDFLSPNLYQGVFVLANTVQFDVDAPLGSLFKLYESTDGTTYVENEAFGGADGATLPLESGFLSAADFADNSIIKKTTVANVEMFVETTLADLMTAESIAMGGEALPYYAYTNIFYQDNATSSGKIRVGSVVIHNTVSDGTSLSLSSKTGTGIYMLQFRTASVGVTGNAFRDEIGNNVFNGAQWEQVEKTILDSNKDVIGKAIFGTNFKLGDFDLAAGRVEVRTYDTAGVLADDILIDGITVSLRSYKQTA